MNLLHINDTDGNYPDSFYALNANTLKPFPKAQGALDCDVCIVGGGFTGLSSALHLARRGYKVILLEAQRVGFGASGRNGGQVSQGQRVMQDDLESLVGVDHAVELWQIAGQAVKLVQNLSQSDLVEADFHPGIVHADHRKRFVRRSLQYAEKLNSEYDYNLISGLGREQVRALVNSNAYHGGTLDKGAGHIDPLQLVLGLARMSIQEGVQIFEQSIVTDIDRSDPATVKTDTAAIKARQVILACNGYLGNLCTAVASRVMPINNYIVATEPLTADQQAALIKNNYAVSDSRFVVNYFRFSDDHRLIFGGTESYRYRFTKDIAGAVRKSMLDIFPNLANTKIDYAWGGTLAITMNRMPHFERISANILSMSGYSGHGVALATFAGQIAAEAIAGQAERFDVMRKVPTLKFPGGIALRSPLLALAMFWYSLRDKL